MVVLLLLAAALALSYAFPQIPAHLRSDPITYDEWLSAIQVRYKGWTPALRAVGAFGVRTAVWFQVLIALAAFVSLISLGHQVSAWIERNRVLQPPAFFQAAGVVRLSVALPVVRAVECLQQALLGLGMRARTRSKGNTTYIAGGRRRRADLSVPLTHLGVLLVIAALAINGRGGWQRTDVQLRPGERGPIGPAGAHRIALVDVDAQGARAEIQVDGGGSLYVDRDHSTRRWAYEYLLTGAGAPLVRVPASRGETESLVLSEYAVRPASVEALHLAFSKADGEPDAGHLFIVPEDKLVVRLQWVNPRETAEGKPPRFRQWVFDQGGQTLIGEAEFDRASGRAETQIGDITYTWDIANYVVLDVVYQPGRWILSLGALLIVIGLVGQSIPRQRLWIWVAARDGQSEVLIRQAAGGMRRRLESAPEALVKALQGEVENT